MTFNRVSELKAITTTPQPNEIATLLGYYDPGDKGAGEFYWDSTSTETDNLGTIIKATSIATGRWKRIYTSSLNIRWFGAKGDGIADDREAFNQCILTGGTGSEILLGRGTYRLTAGLFYLGFSNVRFVGDRCTIKADFTGGTLFTFSVNQAASQPRSEGIEFVDINFVGTGYRSGTTCFSFNGYSKTATPTKGEDYSYFWYIRIIHCNINGFDTAIKFNICRDILVDNCHLVGNKNGIYFLDKHVESIVRDTIILCAGPADLDTDPDSYLGSYCIKSEATYSGVFPTNEGLVIEGCTLDVAQYGIYAKNPTMWKVIGNYIGIQMPYTHEWYIENPGNRAYPIFIERGGALATAANTRVCTIANNNIYQGAIKISNLVNDTWSMLSEISDNIFAGMNDNCIEIGPRVSNLNISGIYAEKFSPAADINGAIIELGSDATILNISKLTGNQKFVNAVNIKGANVTFTNIEGVMHAGSGPVINNPSNNNITIANIRGNGLFAQKASLYIPVNTYNSSNALSVATASIPVFNGMKGRITLVGAFNPSVAGQVLQLATSGVSVTIPNAPGSSAQFHKLYGTGMRMISHVIPFTASATGNLSVTLTVLDYLGGTTGVDYHSFLTIEVDAY